MLMAALTRPLIEAALDQPHPTPDLVRALNRALFATEHPARLAPPNGNGKGPET
jgi:hypothetical protein